MKTTMQAALCAAGLCLAGAASADTVNIAGVLDGTDPTFDHPVSGSVTQTAYDSYGFTVDTDGTYSFLSFYPGDTATDQNLDGVLLLYSGSFDPLNPAGQLEDSDDYSAGSLASLGAFDAACVGQNCSGFEASLTAGTSYFLVQTSFTNVANSFGQPLGAYETVITGPGNVQVVPIPAAVWLFASGLMGLAAMRRKT